MQFLLNITTQVTTEVDGYKQLGKRMGNSLTAQRAIWSSNEKNNHCKFHYPYKLLRAITSQHVSHFEINWAYLSLFSSRKKKKNLVKIPFTIKDKAILFREPSWHSSKYILAIRTSILQAYDDSQRVKHTRGLTWHLSSLLSSGQQDKSYTHSAEVGASNVFTHSFSYYRSYPLETVCWWLNSHFILLPQRFFVCFQCARFFVTHFW